MFNEIAAKRIALKRIVLFQVLFLILREFFRGTMAPLTHVENWKKRRTHALARDAKLNKMATCQGPSLDL